MRQTTFPTAPATVELVDGVPASMTFDRRHWTVTDRPTRVQDSRWPSISAPDAGACGWRFQASDDAGTSLIFDVYAADAEWCVHRTYL
ncbi:hypothetical protein [Microbacterium testaceum]|uniref:hypothetical protein n=1 Tax=Microbacterium testaceum TaxID=2033 RepID=UPI002AC77799|nr:hypothetical protein [Microbacterium testaceum]MDZ5146369.1 hypothetical protein [Microbacterium testaceum]